MRENTSKKRRKLRETLNISEKFLVLVERIKGTTFFIIREQKINKIYDYLLKNLQNNRNLTKTFQRIELFAMKNNFVM